MRNPVKLISRNTTEIALIALLLAFVKARAALSHLDLAVVGLTYPFSTESHITSSMTQRKAHIRTFQKA